MMGKFSLFLMLIIFLNIYFKFTRNKITSKFSLMSIKTLSCKYLRSINNGKHTQKFWDGPALWSSLGSQPLLNRNRKKIILKQEGCAPQLRQTRQLNDTFFLVILCILHNILDQPLPNFFITKRSKI